MSLRKVLPVLQVISAADVAALNVAVATAVTAAVAVVDYIPNSAEVSNVVTMNGQNFVTSISYKKFAAE